MWNVNPKWQVSLLYTRGYRDKESMAKERKSKSIVRNKDARNGVKSANIRNLSRQTASNFSTVSRS